MVAIPSEINLGFPPSRVRLQVNYFSGGIKHMMEREHFPDVIMTKQIRGNKLSSRG